MTIPSKTRKPFTRNTFAEHNYNYAHQPKTNQPPRKIHKIYITYVHIIGISQKHQPLQ